MHTARSELNTYTHTHTHAHLLEWTNLSHFTTDGFLPRGSKITSWWTDEVQTQQLPTTNQISQKRGTVLLGEHSSPSFTGCFRNSRACHACLHMRACVCTRTMCARRTIRHQLNQNDSIKSSKPGNNYLWESFSFWLYLSLPLNIINLSSLITPEESILLLSNIANVKQAVHLPWSLLA